MDIEDVSSFNSNDQRLKNFDQNKFKLFFDEVIANSPKDEKNLQDLIGKLRRKNASLVLAQHKCPQVDSC